MACLSWGLGGVRQQPCAARFHAPHQSAARCAGRGPEAASGRREEGHIAAIMDTVWRPGLEAACGALHHLVLALSII